MFRRLLNALSPLLLNNNDDAGTSRVGSSNEPGERHEWAPDRELTVKG